MKRGEEYLKKFNRLITEYISPVGNYMSEDAPTDQTAAPAPDPMATPAPDPMAAQTPAPDQTAAPAPDPMAAQTPDPMAAPAPAPDQTAVPAPDPMATQTPEPAPTEADGFEPDDDNDEDEEESEKNEEESKDIKKVKSGQNKLSQDIDKLSNNFERLMTKLDSVEKQLNDNNEKIEIFKKDMESRNPSPEQKMTMRSMEGQPFSTDVKDFWNQKEKTSNYKVGSDNNGEDMPEYQIKQSDIDSSTDWANISKSFDDERIGLRGILGY